MKPQQKKIFLSHSSKDEALVDKLADLLTTGCGVHPDDLLITTLPGKGIPAGYENYIEYLQSQIQQPALVILLISKNYLASQFCLCELGATWALSVPNFPLVVPPLKKSEVRATLAVTQLGSIDDEEYLDELRDSVSKYVSKPLPTPTWSAKRDAFLNRLKPIIKRLPEPELVPKSDLNAAVARFESALAEVEERDGQLEKLNARIGELEKLKDSAGVRAVRRKYSSTEEEFENLRDAAKRALRRLKPATVEALFFDKRGERYKPSDPEDWRSVQEAESIKEISADERGCEPDTSHPRVAQAAAAIDELDSFLHNLKDTDFFESFEEDHQFPASVSNKEFWDEIL